MKVARGCRSCIHAGNEFARVMRMACSAVAVPNDRGSQKREGEDQQGATGRQPPAFSEHPRHSGFKDVVERFFEGLVTDVAPEPDPLLAHSYAPCLAPRTGHGKALESPL